MGGWIVHGSRCVSKASSQTFQGFLLPCLVVGTPITSGLSFLMTRWCYVAIIFPKSAYPERKTRLRVEPSWASKGRGQIVLICPSCVTNLVPACKQLFAVCCWVSVCSDLEEMWRKGADFDTNLHIPHQEKLEPHLQQRHSCPSRTATPTRSS